jgi:hypothetical protein
MMEVRGQDVFPGLEEVKKYGESFFGRNSSNTPRKGLLPESARRLQGEALKVVLFAGTLVGQDAAEGQIGKALSPKVLGKIVPPLRHGRKSNGRETHKQD